jgi:hypothetical protein
VEGRHALIMGVSISTKTKCCRSGHIIGDSFDQLLRFFHIQNNHIVNQRWKPDEAGRFESTISGQGSQASFYYFFQSAGPE